LNTEIQSPGCDRRERVFTKKSGLMIVIVGTLLSLAYWRLIPHVHNYPHAGKEFYVGARLLAEGNNPYSSPELQAASRKYAPEGMVAGFDRQPQIHLPATLMVLAPFSLLPWTVYCFLQLVLNTFCIPIIVYLCLLGITARPAFWSLALISLFVAFLAPTWENVVIGQIALPLVLCFLLLARSFARRKVAWLSALTFFALLKFTFALPLIAYVFWKGSRAQRFGMAVAATIFILLNAVAVLRIGPHTFLAGYRTQVARSFGPGGLNDVRTADGQSARLDLESLLAVFPATAQDKLINGAAIVILVGIFLYQCRTRSVFSLWHVSALSLLTLLLFYHRNYDAVLLIPSLFFGFYEWRRKMSAQDQARSKASKSRVPNVMAFVLMVLVLASFGIIGNGSHNILGSVLRHFRTSPPPYLHSLLVLGIYLVVIFGFEKKVLAKIKTESSNDAMLTEPVFMSGLAGVERREAHRIHELVP
jgi:hypothetical protein